MLDAVARPATSASQIHDDFSAALGGELRPLAALWAESTATRQRLIDRLRGEASRERQAELHLLFSLVAWRLGHHEEARTHAHEAWYLIEGRVSAASQALVLTQVAAAADAAGDLGVALRAARRAEALLSAECSDGFPQVLVVRAQLFSITERAGQERAEIRRRRDQAVAALERDANVPGGPGGVRRLVDLFGGSRERVPHWAYLHHLRWSKLDSL